MPDRRNGNARPHGRQRPDDAPAAPLPPAPGAEWRTAPGAPNAADRGAIRHRLRAQARQAAEPDPYAAWLASGRPSTELPRFLTASYYGTVNRRSLAQRAAAHGLAPVPSEIQTEAAATAHRRTRGLAIDAVSPALHAEHAAEWRRRDALTRPAGWAG